MINLIQFLIQILPNVSQINELISLLQARNLKEVKTNLIQEIVLEPGQGQFMWFLKGCICKDAIYIIYVNVFRYWVFIDESMDWLPIRYIILLLLDEFE